MLKSPKYQLSTIVKNSVGLLLFVICSIAIYKKVIVQSNWENLKQTIATQLGSIGIWNWVMLIFLLFLNLWMEAIKWKLVVAKNNPITIGRSFKSVLVGQAFAFFTPNRIGEYAGRTMFLSSGNKIMGLAQMAWTSYAQLLVTVFIGSVALFINIEYYPWMQNNWMLWIKTMSPFVGAIALFLFFYQKPWSGRLQFLNIIQIDSGIKIKLLSLSTARYLVFIGQYYWVAYLLQMNMSLATLFLSLSILFLLLSILPTISISELVVRGQLLIMILTPFYSNQLTIVSLSSIIWGINFLFPAIIGTCLLLGYRIKEKNK
jgi:hypothetical protein